MTCRPASSSSGAGDDSPSRSVRDAARGGGGTVTAVPLPLRWPQPRGAKSAAVLVRQHRHCGPLDTPSAARCPLPPQSFTS